LRQVETQANATEKAFSGVTAAVGKLVAAFAAVQAVRFVFVQAAELQSQARSLEVLTGSAEKAGKIIKELQQLGAVTPFTSTELIDSAKRLQAFGVETEKVVEITRRLADVSGATGAELQGLVTAYGQVQAKGRLQGEELLQFQERGVALQTELRKMYGLSGEEFQKALSKGQVSAKAVEIAIQRLTEAGGKYANGAIAQSDTLNGKLSTLQDSFQRLAQNIGKFFEPVFKFLLDGINAFLERVNSAQALQNQTRAYQEASTRTRARFGARVMNPFDKEVQQYRRQLEKSLLGNGRPVAAAPSAPAALPRLMAPIVGGGGRGGGGRSAADEAKKLAEELQRSVEQGDALFRQFSRQAALLGNISDDERKRLEIQYEYQDRAREIAELKNAEQRANLADLNNEIKRLEIKQLETEELREQLELIYQRSGFAQMPEMLPGGAGAFRTDIDLGPQNKVQQFVQQGQAQLKDLESTAISISQGIGDAVGNSLANGIAGLIEGTAEAKDVFASFLRDVGQLLVQEGAKMIATYIAIGIAKMFAGLGGGGIFGSGGAPNLSGAFSSASTSGLSGFTPGLSLMPGLANGGPASVGTPYVVGERGPELFVPSANGGVLSNQDLRAAMNRNAGGAAGAPVLNMSFETTTIGGVEYVSRDQLEAAMAETRRAAARDGAQRGMTMTLDRIQNSSSTRRRIGV
jgi:tape measure domain-containing protein